MVENVLKRIDSNLDQSIEKLFALLRFQSISTDPAYREACYQGADWLVNELSSIGFEASRRDTPGCPMVVAHYEGPSPDSLHVLFYGHYDVQPVDPIEQWHTGPFEPEIKELNGQKVIVARGASDDKGQLMTFVSACRAWVEEKGALPLKVTILFEGEEESGSPSLIPFLQSHEKELKADVALVCDTNMWDASTPAITVALRGLMALEVRVIGPNRDLHSGYYGGAAANPITILARALGDIHDDHGHITIEGFYDDIEPISPFFLDSWASLNCDEAAFLSPVGLSKSVGEEGYSVLEQTWGRPTVEINGISGGYEGDGIKTVIASQAMAKISCRLVPGQDPEKIRAQLKAFIKARVPQDCQVEFIDLGGSPAIRVPHDSPYLAKAKAALTNEWDKEAVMIASGGSIPIVGDFQRLLDMQSLLIGFGLEDDNIHSPNEKYSLLSYQKGQRSWARILSALAKKVD